MSQSNPISRRHFFQRAAFLGASAAGAIYLVGCDRGGAGSSAAPSGPSCDISGLTDAERTMRGSLQYVDQTPNPEQNCLNCGLWVEPEGAGPCGGCELPLGPVHPEGWCSSWVAAG